MEKKKETQQNTSECMLISEMQESVKQCVVLVTVVMCLAFGASNLIYKYYRNTEQDVDTIQQSIEGLQQSIEGLQQSIEGLQQSDNEIQQSIERLQQSVNEIQQSVQYNRDDVEILIDTIFTKSEYIFYDKNDNFFYEEPDCKTIIKEPKFQSSNCIYCYNSDGNIIKCYLLENGKFAYIPANCMVLLDFCY